MTVMDNMYGVIRPIPSDCSMATCMELVQNGVSPERPELTWKLALLRTGTEPDDVKGFLPI